MPQLLKFDMSSGQLVPAGTIPDNPIGAALSAIRALFDEYNAKGYTDDQAGAAFKAIGDSGFKVDGSPASQQQLRALMDNYLTKTTKPGLTLATGGTIPTWIWPLGISAVIVVVLIMRQKSVPKRRR